MTQYEQTVSDALEAKEKALGKLRDRYSDDKNKFIINNVEDFFGRNISSGLVVDLDKAISDLNKHVGKSNDMMLYSPEYASYKATLIECCQQARKKQFFDYTLATEPELVEMKQEELYKYASLIERLENLNEQGKIKPDIATITFENMIVTENHENPFIRSGEIPFDTKFAMATTMCRNIGLQSKPYSSFVYGTLMASLNETKNAFLSMTPDEFRSYKIAQLRLSPLEIEKMRENAKANPKQFEPDLKGEPLQATYDPALEEDLKSFGIQIGMHGIGNPAQDSIDKPNSPDELGDFEQPGVHK